MEQDDDTTNHYIIRGEAKEALMYWGLTEVTAKKIVMAINDGKIPHIKINY